VFSDAWRKILPAYSSVVVNKNEVKKSANPLVMLLSGRKSNPADAGVAATPNQQDPLLASQQLDADRLQRIAVVIENVVGELGRVEHLRMLLEALRDPISSEFDAQMKSIAQTAELRHRLSSTAARLGELEAEQKAVKEQFQEARTRLERSGTDLEDHFSARQAAEQELAETRPALAQARSQVEELSRRVSEQEARCSNLEIANESLSVQFEKTAFVNKDLSNQLEQLHHDFVSASDQLADTRNRAEAAQVRALRAERVVEDLNGALSAERERVAGLEGKIQTIQASANRMITSMLEKDDERLVEIATLRNRLGDVQTRCASLEEAREKSVAELQGLNAERGSLSRDLSAREVELIQVRNRLESLERALDEVRRRASDVEAARLVAVQRGDGLAKQLTSLESRSVRSEVALEQKVAEIEALRSANGELKSQLSTTSEELNRTIVQQKSEIDMLRSALNAVQKTKQFIAATT
jgi:chromosome segregation ATPase